MAAVDEARISSEHRQRTAPRMSPSCSLAEARRHLVLLVRGFACPAGSVSRLGCWLYRSTALTLSSTVYLGEDLCSQIVAFAPRTGCDRHSPN